MPPPVQSGGRPDGSARAADVPTTPVARDVSSIKGIRLMAARTRTMANPPFSLVVAMDQCILQLAIFQLAVASDYSGDISPCQASELRCQARELSIAR